MRRLFGFLLTLAAILLVFAIFFTCVQFTVTDRKFFENEYIGMDTARRLKMTQSELMKVTDHLLKYMTGDEEDLQIKAKINGKSRNAFDKRESEHMVDVAELYQTAKNYRNIAVVLVAIITIMALIAIKKDRIGLFAQCYLVAISAIGACILALGIWILVDFNSFWNAFHLVFFRNDLWQLDENSSLMINLFPLQFWLSVCKRILMHFAATAGTLLIASFVYLKYRSHRRKSVMAIRGNDADEY